MALKYKLLENGEGIEIGEDGHPIVFDDEKEGEKPFPLDAIHLYSKIPSLQAEAKSYREKKDEYKKQLEAYSGLSPEEIREKMEAYSGIDPIAAKKALETVANMDQLDKDRSVKVEEIRENTAKGYIAQIAELKKQFQNQIEDVSHVISQKDASIRNLLVKGAFDRSEFIKNHTVVPPDMAYDTFGKHFKIEEENGSLQVFAVNRKGEKIYSMSKPGDPASPEEAIEALINEYQYKDNILKTNNGGSGAGGNVNSNATERQRLEALKKMNPEERLAHLRRH